MWGVKGFSLTTLNFVIEGFRLHVSGRGFHGQRFLCGPRSAPLISGDTLHPRPYNCGFWLQQSFSQFWLTGVFVRSILTVLERIAGCRAADPCVYIYIYIYLFIY